MNEFQDPSFKKFIATLKESNKTTEKTVGDILKSNKDNKKALTEMVNHGRRDLGLQTYQLKTERDILKDENAILKDEDRGDELLESINKTLDDIRNTIKGKGGVGSGPGKQSAGVEPAKKLESKRLGTLDWTDSNFGEDIRTMVAGSKNIGSNIASGAKKGFGALVSAAKAPGQAIKSSIGAIKDVGKGIRSSVSSGINTLKDIAATPADYDYQRERFNTAFEKSDIAKDYRPRDEQGKFVAYKERGKGRVAYDLTKEQQDKMEGVQARMDAQKAEGFAPTKADVAEMDKRSEHLQHIDPRIVEQAKKNDEKTLAAVNPAADNIESSGEKETKELAENNKTLGQLLAVTKEQLDSVKAIKDAVASSTPKEIESKPAEAKQEPAPVEAPGGGSSLVDTALDIGGDLLSRGKAGAGKAAGKAGSVGGKILGGLGKAARVLGPAAAVAGAAYSGFQGYQNTGANFDLKEGQEATTGQKISSTLGGVASGLTFGLLDEKTASQGLHKMGSAVGDFFGGKSVTPASAAGNGAAVGQTSVENNDMARNNAGGSGNNTVVSNNVSTNNTTKYVPLKGTPRPETQGSALERYQNRISAF